MLFTVVLMRTDTVIARVWLIEPYFALGSWSFGWLFDEVFSGFRLL